MKDIVIYTGAAFFEIFGCFAFWSSLKLNKLPNWLFPGIISLVIFASLLSLIQSEFAGRSYAIYGGIYIAASLLWMYLVEHQSPDKWDIIGAVVCITGVAIILYAPR